MKELEAELKMYKEQGISKENYFSSNLSKVLHSNAEFLSDVTDYILANLSNQDLKVDQIAGNFYMSQSTFYRRIKEVANVSPVELLQQIKLEHAAKLLLTSTDHIEQIAYQSGFNNAGYFSKTFQKRYGKTPTEFKNDIA